MNTDELVEGKKYYFYETPPNSPENVYRATYLSVFANLVMSYLIKRRFDTTTNQNVIMDMVDDCVRVLTEYNEVVASPVKTFAANIHDIRYSLLENKEEY